jgi:hypothetical protein
MSADIAAFKGIEPRPLDLMLLTLDPGVQPRAALDQGVVVEYSEALEQGAVFPPLLVVETPSEFLLVDGWHRRAAAQRLGVDNLPARIMRASADVAIELMAQCNAKHGHRRTQADLTKVVAMLTALPRWKQATDASIAAHCGVSRQAAQRARALSCPPEQDTEVPEIIDGEPVIEPDETLSGGTFVSPEPPPRVVRRGCQTYEMRTSEIGRNRSRTVRDLQHQRQDEREPPPLPPMGGGMRRMQAQADRADLARCATLWGNLSDADKRALADQQVIPWRLADWKAQGTLEIGLPDALIRIEGERVKA